MSEKLSHNLFIVSLTYKISLDKIDKFRLAHMKFLEDCYEKKLFIASGPKVPRTGGVIIAKTDSKNSLDKVLANDPFIIHNLASYDIVEFTANKWVL